MSFALITDSCCNLTDELIDELDITVLSMTVRNRMKEYTSYVKGEKTDNKKFYTMLRSGDVLVTAALNAETCRDAFEKVLSAGEDLLYVAFSSALSGTCNVAQMMAEELKAKYPERRVVVLDSRCASMGEGLFVYYAGLLRKQGKSLNEVVAWLLEHRGNLCHWFTVEDLHFLKRGGRVSAATAIVGTALGIKPVLHVDDEGRLINMEKARGRKKSLLALVDHMEQTVTEPEKQVVFIGHGDCEEDAAFVAQEVRRRMKVKDIVINYIDPVIGAHSGPGTVALFFLGTHR